MRTLLLTIALALMPNVFAFNVPPADGYITDIAGVLSASQEQSLEINLQNYRGETSNEIGILIVQSLQGEDISEVAVDVGRAWGVGSKENNNGILLLIAIDDRKLFIATGYGLEGAVPDLAAKSIIDNEIVPYFKDGDYNAGITAGVEALKLQIGGEYKGSGITGTIAADDMPTGLWVMFAIIGMLLFFFVYQFFIGILVTISPSRSWWEGAFLGGLFGFFFAGVAGLVTLALIGAATDFIASMLYVHCKPFREFLNKQKKNIKNKEGIWFIGGGRGGSGGSSGGGFSGGSFGGGGAGGSW